MPLPRVGALPAHRSYPKTLGRIGSLEVRLARTWTEVRQAQALRYRVFYREMSARPSMRHFLLRRDADRFDPICDHLLVIDHAPDWTQFPRHRRNRPVVVGTYRLLRQEVAERHGGFYSEDEFTIRPMLAAQPATRFLEVGRSCVLEAYRTKRTMELLWMGIYRYLDVFPHDVLFGCASLHGTDPERLKEQLSYLHHFASAGADWPVAALDARYIEMNRMPKEAINIKQVLRDLPPLIKGYLRINAKCARGAVIDAQFGTTDVCVIFAFDDLQQRYADRFKWPDNERPADTLARQTG
ncbi:MAG: GNAT family N-acyltransferase [Pseudomonadota bacterium]